MKLMIKMKKYNCMRWNPSELITFLVIVDTTIASFTSRFEHIKTVEHLFGFLYNSKILKSLCDNDLHNCCTTFAKTFTHDNLCDVDLDAFFSELKVLDATLLERLLSAHVFFSSLQS
jgi:hypothetical protein